MDDVLLIVDDLKSHEPARFSWVWHPGGKAVKRGSQIDITSGQSSVVLRPIYPRPLAESDYVHDYPDDLYWTVADAPTENLQSTEQYYTFHLPQVCDQVKAVTAIILKDSPDQTDLPQITRREGKDWIGLRITHRGRTTDIYINQLADGRLMHLNSWIEADGWQTDAYLFAATYDTGKPASASDRLMLFSASSLRRDGQVWFSSLAKLSLITDQTDVKATGQPSMRFQIRRHNQLQRIQCTE